MPCSLSLLEEIVVQVYTSEQGLFKNPLLELRPMNLIAEEPGLTLHADQGKS
jgi:hypothetical protein